MRIAILGAGSCFAMNLARQLVDRGDEVLAISRSPMRPPAFTYGLEDCPQYHYKVAHLVSEQPLVLTYLDVFAPEIVINFAALCEVGQSWNHALDYYETNLMSLTRLTDALANRTWLKRFVQIGSSEVYGSVECPADEDHPVKPSSPYAASKAAFDFHLRAISRHQGFPAAIVMPSNGYCEGQTLNRIMPKTIICAMNGTRMQLQGGGTAKKSYLHADDISRAIMLVADMGAVGETYNVGPLMPISIREVVERIAIILGKELTDVAEIAPERTGQDSCYWLDATKIGRLGWRQEVAFADGLLRMINWVRAHPELLFMDATYSHRP